MAARRSLLVAAIVVAVALEGCGARDSAPGASAPRGAVMLNNVSAADVLDAINKAKLPALNPRDATASKCPEAGCLQATATDTVTILKFPSTGRAEIYAAAVPDMIQVEDVVLVFPPAVTGEQKSAYGRVVNSVMAGR